ncbi:MAG: P-loop NTPase [Acidimicrobiales bacterium]
MRSCRWGSSSTDETDALMWRGLMLNCAVQHFLEDVDWGDLDYLLIDLRPAPATSRWASPACSPHGAARGDDTGSRRQKASPSAP